MQADYVSFFCEETHEGILGTTTTLHMRTEKGSRSKLNDMKIKLSISRRLPLVWSAVCASIAIRVLKKEPVVNKKEESVVIEIFWKKQNDKRCAC